MVRVRVIDLVLAFSVAAPTAHSEEGYCSAEGLSQLQRKGRENLLLSYSSRLSEVAQLPAASIGSQPWLPEQAAQPPPAAPDLSFVRGTGNWHLPGDRVLFLVYSGSKFYDTRVRWVTDTWASKLSNDTFVVVGDEEARPGMRATVHTTSCIANSHEEGACCKYSEAVRVAHALMKANPTLTWAYFVDDDAYVRTDLLSQALLRRDPRGEGKGVAFGKWTCSTKRCRGLCGGTGYAMSRLAVDLVAAGRSGDSARQEQMQNCARCDRWADIGITQALKDRGVALKTMDGLQGRRLSKSCFEASKEQAKMFHYITSQEQMELLHRIYTSSESLPALNVVENATARKDFCSFLPGRQVQCAQSVNAADLPWDLIGKPSCENVLVQIPGVVPQPGLRRGVWRLH